MTGSGYTVASAGQLSGESIPATLRIGKKGANQTKDTSERGSSNKYGSPSSAPHTIATDTSTGNSSSNLTRKNSKRSKTNSQITKIYFSPIDISSNKVELSDPLPTPPLTPTQERYNAAQAAAKQYAPVDPFGRRSRSVPQPKELHVSHEQLDRLVTALADSPVVKKHAERVPPIESSISSPKSTIPPDSYSISNATTAPRVKLGGIALIDPKTNGSPVRFLSKHYRHRTDVLRVGQNLYLNLPYGKGAGCYLRTEPGRVIMQIVDRTVERKTGKMACFLVVELDVTESFAKAALTELAEGSGVYLENIEVTASVEGAEETSSVDIDWCALADELQETCDTSNIVDQTVASFATLQMETCTMQTLTLVSELERIKRKHQNFMVLQSHAEHENGVPSRMSVPWVSINQESRSANDRTPSIDSTPKFREELIGIVAKQPLQTDPFTAKFKLVGEEKSVHFMPLSGSAVEKNVAWACFVRDSSDM